MPLPLSSQQVSRPPQRQNRSRNLQLLPGFVLLFLVLFSGCHIKFATRQIRSQHPEDEQYYIDGIEQGYKSPSTNLVLRTYQLDKTDGHGLDTLSGLLERIEREPTPDLIAAFSELAYVEGRRLEKTEPGLAAKVYAAGTLQAFNYLFDPRFSSGHNLCDVQFHNVRILYNNSLERLLRLLMNDRKNLRLRPGDGFHVQTADQRWDVHCQLITGSWLPDEIDYFTFACDYKLTGVKHEYRQGGLGVPLIAKRKSGSRAKREEKYYPTGVRFPVTAFLRPRRSDEQDSPCNAVLELHDPLIASSTSVDGRQVPLETDLTTPLVCFLSNPTTQLIPTLGLVRPDHLLKAIPDSESDSERTAPDRSLKGIYMIEPYDPKRIPVVFIHGLWSSPFTWMEMYNALRSIENLQDHYQFWFYFYPSGQPFWVSAAQLRDDLAEVRRTLDPQHESPSLDEMVLIGHSMGGLIARLQVMSPEDRFWSLVSSVALDDTELDSSTKNELSRWFFFEPNQSIRRIVTIATPFEGSRAANSVSQWFAHHLISIPRQFASVASELVDLEKDDLPDNSLIHVKTSIESLSPKCTIYGAMATSPILSSVACNNIVGLTKEDTKWYHPTKPGDGVVEFDSAHRTDVESEKIVNTTHMQIHLHPATIHETKRILVEHLNKMRRERTGRHDDPSVQRR